MILRGLLLGLVLCVASVGAYAEASDPFEPFNRTIFAFNRGLLEDVVDPGIEHLGPHIPRGLLESLSNIYSNLTEIEFFLNGLLVGDFSAAGVSALRFAMNSTLGLGGLYDFAGQAGLERTERDFIESICQTGLPPGPYIVFPMVGPANLNSAVALVAIIALEVYLISLISTTLAVIDLIIIDIAGTASALRYMRDLPLDTAADPYLVQREDHLSYVRQACDAVDTGPAVTAR